MGQILDGLQSQDDQTLVARLSLSKTIVDKMTNNNTDEYRCGENAARAWVLSCLKSACTVADAGARLVATCP